MMSNIPSFTSIKAGQPSNASSPMEKKRLKEACQAFEALFIQEIMKGMRRTIPQGGVIEKDFRHRMYESMFDEKISQTLAQRGDLGIAQMLYKELAK